MVASLMLLALALSGCAAAQVSAEPPTESLCPEPPPPPEAASSRAAAAFFEMSDIADWADEFDDGLQMPSIDDVVLRLRAVVEAMVAVEEAAASLRIYEVAENARRDVEELLTRMVGLGVHLPPEERRLLVLIEQDEPIELLEDPLAELPVVLEDLSVMVTDGEDFAVQVAELEALSAADASDRAEAQCLMARLEGFVELNDIVHMLEEETVELRIEAQQGDDSGEARRQLSLLESQLEAAHVARAGCRRGGPQALEAVTPLFSISTDEADAQDLQEIAQEVIDACRSAAGPDQGQHQRRRVR